MVMVVPIDPDMHEAEHVADENREQRFERREFRAVRDFHLQDHDRDGDREDAVAERLHSRLAHGLPYGASMTNCGFRSPVAVNPVMIGASCAGIIASCGSAAIKSC